MRMARFPGRTTWPGRRISQTVEVFAARQGIAPETFYQLMDSEIGMADQVFACLPLSQLNAYRQTLIRQNLQFLHSDLQFISHHSPYEWQRLAHPGIYGGSP